MRLYTLRENSVFNLKSFVDHLVRAEGQAVIVDGLIALILTAVCRVAVFIVTFAIEKDRAYIFFAATVLAPLILSFFLARFSDGLA